MVLRSKFVVALGVVSTCAISAFAVYRFLKGDMLLSAIDGTLAFLFALITAYTYATQKVDKVRYIAIILAFLGTLLAIYTSPDSGGYWVYVTTLAISYLLPSYIYAIRTSMTLLIIVLGLVILNSTHSHINLIPFTVTTLVINFFAYLFAYNNEKSQIEIQKLTITDPLTGIGNRRAFNEKVVGVANLYQRLDLPACLLFIDVDSFKQINDQYGHAEGDKVLIAIADCLTATLRKTDHIYRLGGDEFVILVEGTTQEQTSIPAEKVRVNIEKLTLSCGKTITISMGGAEICKQDTGESWTQRADEALYEAKSNGKNKVVFQFN